MPQQPKITSFFLMAAKPELIIVQNTGQSLSSLACTGDAAKDDLCSASGEPSPKRLKAVHDENELAAQTQDDVTDQQNRAHWNYVKARVILQSKKTPLVTSSFGLTWFEALEKEFSKDYFKKLSEFVTKERQSAVIYPPADQVFSWTTHFPIQQTRVVILGQDPYHGPRQAHGLCFSVMKGVALPPSLLNIYKELSSDVPGFTSPSHGNLSGWANQGVLLLNAVLTVRSSAANSHKGLGWELFTDAVIDWLNRNLCGIVFVLWGRYAQEKGAKIDKKRHHVLTSAHPSPLSATKFFGCKHFSAANRLLVAQGKKAVDWSCLKES